MPHAHCTLLVCWARITSVPASTTPETAGREAAPSPEREAAREAIRAVGRRALGRRRGQRLREVGEHHLLARGQPVLDLGPRVADGPEVRRRAAARVAA